MKKLLPFCLAILLLLPACTQAAGEPSPAPASPIATTTTNTSTAQPDTDTTITAAEPVPDSEYGRLPAVYLTTGEAVASRTALVGGTFELKIGERTLYDPGLSTGALPMKIRGRGTSSWEWPKKPYLVKLDKHASLFGLPKAKDWVLRPSYSDESLIRDHLASVMGRTLGNLGYVPRTVLVDVYLNGAYRGVYVLSEQIEAKAGRVTLDVSPAEDTGYLIEIGGGGDNDAAGRDYFNTESFNFAYVIDPKPGVRTAAQMRFITDYVRKADAAVIALTGYEDYIDIPSLIDWFILHELTYNLDSSFRRSCFMTKNTGGKLKMGPPWDFDLAFGNHFRYNNTPNVWASVSREDGYVGVTWMDHLLKDPNFTAQLKARWNQVGAGLVRTALNEIDLCEKVIDLSQKENFKTWNTLGSKTAFEPGNIAGITTYAGKLQQLRSFLATRKAWMDKTIGGM